MEKELVVFFSGHDCKDCEAAWSAFTKDEVASKQYVFTRLDIRDFDGGVFFEHFGFKQIPGWVILSPKAVVKEKWEGGWKNSGGSPIINSTPVTKPTPTIVPDNSSTGFVLQAGYFGSEVNAEKLIEDLKTKGYSDFKIEPVLKDGATFYRVISRVYYSENEINAEQERLNGIGIKTSVKK